LNKYFIINLIFNFYFQLYYLSFLYSVFRFSLKFPFLKLFYIFNFLITIAIYTINHQSTINLQIQITRTHFHLLNPLFRFLQNIYHLFLKMMIIIYQENVMLKLTFKCSYYYSLLEIFGFLFLANK